MAAKKNAKSAPAKSAKKAPAKGKSTSVRHTSIPQAQHDLVVPAMTRELTYDMIARRAYEIWQSNGGNEFDNWTAAENELRAA